MRHVPTLALAASFAVVAAAPLAHAWDNYGHELVAYIAYQDLTPAAKTRVNELLRKHPQYEELLAKGCPTGFDKDLFVFMRAATWPDLMLDEKLDPGLKEHHGPWHYVNNPIGPEIHGDPPSGAWKAGSDPENILQAYGKCRHELRSGEESERAKRLCWIEHLIGDIHQPLNTVSAFAHGFEDGDQGGNLFIVSEKGKVWKLHAYWDDLLGSGDDAKKIAKRGDDIRKSKDLSRVALSAPLRNPEFAKWVNESIALARDVVYGGGKLAGKKSVDKEHLPASAPSLPGSYRKKAEDVAEKQIALAGYRLADELNEWFKSSHD